MKTVKPGDRVLVSCVTVCGTCRFCREGHSGQCLGGGGWIFGYKIDGTQAEYVRVPFADTSTYPVPDGADDEDILMLADILPTAYEVGVLNGGVRPGDVVAIVGADPIGLSAITGARLFSPSHIVAIDLADSRLEAAKQFGADVTVNNASEDPLAVIRSLTGGLGADVAIEAVGAPATFGLAVQLSRPGGRIANIGVHGEPATLHLEEQWIRNITITTGLVDTYSTPTLLRLVTSQLRRGSAAQLHAWAGGEPAAGGPLGVRQAEARRLGARAGWPPSRAGPPGRKARVAVTKVPARCGHSAMTSEGVLAKHCEASDQAGRLTGRHREGGIQMRRISAFRWAGLALAVILLAAGGLLLWGSTYVHNTVQSQLAAQQIYFPPKAAFAHPKAGTEITPSMIPSVSQYAGQQMLTGQQAEAYADHFIAVHLTEIGGGKTYSQLSTEAIAHPTNAALAGQVATVFKGTTLRSMLLNAYGWWKVSQIVYIAAIAAFALGGLALIGSAFGFASRRQTRPQATVVPATGKVPATVA